MAVSLSGILAFVNVKSYDVGEDLDYVNCKCRKRLIDKLVEKCDEYIDGNEMVYNASCEFGLKKRVCISRMLYVILLIIVYIVVMGINSVFFLLSAYQWK